MLADPGARRRAACSSRRQPALNPFRKRMARPPGVSESCSEIKLRRCRGLGTRCPRNGKLEVKFRALPDCRAMDPLTLPQCRGHRDADATVGRH